MKTGLEETLNLFGRWLVTSNDFQILDSVISFDGGFAAQAQTTNGLAQYE